MFGIWTQGVQPAREAARRIRCADRSHQHSGYHPDEIVRLDQNGKVLSVGTCPVCSRPGRPIVYLSQGGVVLSEATLPPQTIEVARNKLVDVRAKPRYRAMSDMQRRREGRLRAGQPKSTTVVTATSKNQ